jgi:hypothetical protein
MAARRDWSEVARRMGRTSCRVRGLVDDECEGPIEWAHVPPREHDEKRRGRRGGITYVVSPLAIVCLCRHHHDRFDNRVTPKLDLHDHLFPVELEHCIKVMGFGPAMRRIRGRDWACPMPEVPEPDPQQPLFIPTSVPVSAITGSEQ